MTHTIRRLFIARPNLVRASIVAGLKAGLLASFPVLGFIAARRSPTLALVMGAAPFLLIGLRLALAQSHLGPLIILLAATATRWYVSRGITPALVLTAFFAVAWLAQRVALKHHLRLIESPVIAPALGFIMIALISLPWGRAMADPLLFEWPRGGMRGSAFEFIQLAQLSVLVLGPAAFILSAQSITRERHLRILIQTYLGLTTVGLFAELLRLPLQVNLWGLTSTWAVSLLYGQLLFNRKLSNWLRLAYVIVIGVWLYKAAVLGITWKSGWVPVVVSMCVITLLKSRKAFLVLLVVLCVLAYVAHDWWQMVWALEYAESLGNRLDKWVFLFGHHSTRGHLLLGTGPFGYALYFMTYFPDNAASTHSNYIDLLLQLGVVGCAVFAWLVAAIARVGWKLHATHIEDPFAAGFVRGALGGLVGVLAAMFLGDWLIPFVLNQGLHGFSWTVSSWIILGALPAVAKMVDQQRARKPE